MHRNGLHLFLLMNESRAYRRGIAIPVAITIVAIIALISIFSLNYGRNQDAKTFHIVNIEKARLVADATIEAATFKVRSEMNNMGNLNPIDIVKGVVSMLSNPGASWYLKMRIPGIVVTGGVGSSTGISGVNADVSLSPDTLGFPPNWSEQKLNAGSLGINQFIKEIGGDENKTKVSCKLYIKDMKPVVSDSGAVLWPGAVTDESFMKDWLKKMGNQFFDFLGLNDIKIKIDLSGFLKGLTISIMGIPIPIGNLLAGILKNFLTIEINVGAMISKALEKIIDQLKIGDIMPIKADVIIEKLATLAYNVRVEYVPDGSSIPFITEVEATRDVKVVDMVAPNPIYSFFWQNNNNETYSEKTWCDTGGGKFKLMNLNLDADYSGSFSLNDILNFFKGLFSLSIVRFPGLAHFGGAGEQVIPTGLNDLLLIYPGHTPAITMIGNYGVGQCYFPSALLMGIPADGIPWFPWVSVPPLGVAGIIALGVNIAKKRGNTQLFGDFCLSPTINFKINGNVKKSFKHMRGVGFTIVFPFGAIGAGVHTYLTEKKGYSYSFLEKEAKAEINGMIENIYKPDQYKKKATTIYADGNELMKDDSVFDVNNTMRLDGVLYVEGNATLGSPGQTLKIYGAGQIVVKGDLAINGTIHHLPKDGNRLIPFSIICFGNVSFNSGCRVLSPIYAEKGVSVAGDTHIMGNLVCREFNPGRISKDLTVWFTPEITTCSFLSLIPYVGRYMPDRYRVVLANQFSTYKINKLK